MYNTEVTADSKYHVADILSSMAHGDHNTPNFSTSAYTSGILSLTTPTLTPTSLANIEQTFIELQSVPVTSTTDSGPLRYTQSGFMPPVVEPHYGYDSGSERDWSPASSNAGSVIGGRKRGDKSLTPYSVLARRYPSLRRRDLKNEKVSPEEDERRKVRRDRNKQAAAKCRQRRMDVQSTLQQETECLEDDNNSLESEIHSLQQQKEQLEFLLQSHRNVCKKHNNATSVIVKHESKLDCLHRPNTLSIPTTTSEIGVPITTPSSGVFTFGFDTMVDGSTGLTPITGVPSCSQQHRDSSESSPDALSPKLISL